MESEANQKLGSIGIAKVYEEACSTVRHYSSSVRNIRTVTIAQGFAILSAIGFLAKDGKVTLILFASIFCLILTNILYQLHRHYLNNALAAIEFIQDIEDKYSAINTGG